MSWYVLYTASRVEKQVVQRLKAYDVETYLPLHLTPRKWSDRVKLIEMPLFSSYVFVKTTDEKLRTLVGVNGISRIVFYNGSPALVRDSEIEAIRLFIEEAKGKICTFDVDDEVRIACGPLKDKSGKLIRVGKKYVLLHIEQLGLTVSLKYDQVVRKIS